MHAFFACVLILGLGVGAVFALLGVIRNLLEWMPYEPPRDVDTPGDW